MLILKNRILIIASLCLLVGYCAYWGWVNLGTWLVKADAPRASEVIVCLSGVERIRKAADLYHEGLAPRIILTVKTNRQALTGLGVPEYADHPGPRPQDHVPGGPGRGPHPA